MILTVAVVAALYFFKRPQETVAEINTPFEMSGPFVGAENANTSADALSLGRVLRAYFDSSADGDNSALFISTQINWPQETPQQLQTIQLLPQTEYLCWPSTFVNGDGTEAQIKDTIYMLDNTHKLFLENQKPMFKEEALQALHEGMPVIVALQQSYSEHQPSVAFQIAIVGCK